MWLRVACVLAVCVVFLGCQDRAFLEAERERDRLEREKQSKKEESENGDKHGDTKRDDDERKTGD